MNFFEAREKLESMADAAGVIEGRRKARFIFEHHAGLSTVDLYKLNNEESLPPWRYAQMVRSVNRLISGTPVQLILGYTRFYDHAFICRRGVMIPRPETETLVEAAIREIDARSGGIRVLDLFTGSGIIAISLAMARPENYYCGSDLSRKAINLARENARNIGAYVDWRAGDMFTPFKDEGKFDIICANPPYIRTSELKNLPLDVRTGDPEQALDGGPEGLKFHKRLADESPEWVKPSGCLMVEMGYDQRIHIEEIFKQRKPEFIKDLWGKDRVYVVRY